MKNKYIYDFHWLWMEINSSKEYPFNDGVPQGSILSATIFLMTFVITLSTIFSSMLMILLNTPHVIKHLFVETTTVGLWTWIWPTRHCRLGQEKDLLISMQENLNLFGLTSLITGAIDVKMDGSVLEERPSFTMLG